MDIKQLRDVINNTAKLKAKEITLANLAHCLDAVTFPTGEAILDNLWKISYQYYSVLKAYADEGFVDKVVGDSSVCEEEVINLSDQSNFLTTVDLVRQFTLHLYLPRELREMAKSEAQLMAMVEEQERVRRLSFCVAQFRCLFEKKMLAIHPRMGECVIDFIAGSYDLSAASVLKQVESIAFPRELIFKSLLMIKGSREVSVELAKVLHRDLLSLTGEPGGFSLLCHTLLTLGERNEEDSAWRKSEVIAKIITSKGHTKKFYRQVLTDCFELYHWAVYADTPDALTYASTAVECFKRFYQLPAAYRELHERIGTYFVGRFKELAFPGELITGCVVMEGSKLLTDLYECNMAFTGSSVTSLPSSVLLPYHRLLLRLYSILPATSSKENNYLQNMIIFYLANRTKEELLHTVLSIAKDSPSDGLFDLHPRIIVQRSHSNGDSYTLQIGSAVDGDSSEGSNLLPVLVNMLKLANRNLLMHDVFVILLNELMISTVSGIPALDNVLLDSSERAELLCKRFRQKCVLIQSLGDLVVHKHFHNQLYEHPDEVLNILESSLTQMVNVSDESSSTDIMDVVLSILQEFLKRIRNEDKVAKTMKLLQQYRRSAGCSTQTKLKIDYICTNTSSVGDNTELSESMCQNALGLCADEEPYCKVYGTTLLLKLLKDRDVETVAQRHTILVLALENLRSEESYAFLNSVRLLVALCDVLESETVDSLVKEYLNEDNQLDYRLKIGEATLKTIEALGPFAVRYRDELFNCFIAGAQHPVDEFRTSSLSNIGNICRILCYQVHHIFYELFTTITGIMETEKYLPARRAAILVLSQVIQGMERLMDFEEYLLLVYRFLKHVIATDQDDVTRLQAAVALDHLKAKTKDFLTIDPVDLESRMFGRLRLEK